MQFDEMYIAVKGSEQNFRDRKCEKNNEGNVAPRTLSVHVADDDDHGAGGRGRRETGPVIFLNAGSNTTAGPGMLMSNGPPPPNPQGNGPSTANATANGTPPGNRAPKGAMPSQRLGLRATPLPPDANMAPKALKGPCQQLRRSPDLLVIMPQSFQLPEPKLGLPAPKLELPGSKLELPACSSPLPPARSSFLMLEIVADV